MIAGTLTTEVRDKHGKTLSKKQQPLRSYVANTLIAIRSVLAGTSTGTLLNGSTFSLGISSYWSSSSGGPTITKGILVGSGDTASDFEDFTLETIIDNGSSAGQLVRGLQTYSPSHVSGLRSVTATRTFTNQSGNAVDVNEIAVYGATADETSTANTHCVIRDVLESTDTVPDEGVYLVTIDCVFDGAMMNDNGAAAMVGRWSNHVGTLNIADQNDILGNADTNNPFSRGLVIGAIDDNIGIMVGSDATAFNRDSTVHNTLVAEIANGTSSGQLTWTATTVDDPVVDASGGFVRIRRTFLNTSGGVVSINEIGLYSSIAAGATDTNIYMTVRAVLGTTLVIPDGSAVEILIDYVMDH